MQAAVIGTRRSRYRLAVSRLLFVLGFRETYRFENTLTALAILAFVATRTLDLGYPGLLSVAVLVASPALLQYYAYRTGSVLEPGVPLFSVLTSAVLAGFSPILAVPALLNVMLMEDVTTLLDFVEPERIKNELRLFMEPLRRHEFSVILGVVTASALVAYYVAGDPIVFVYPLISYAMLVYSVVVVPPSYRQEETRYGFLEEIARRLPILYYIFIIIYNKPHLVTLGKEAGLVGAMYARFVRKAGGAFALSIYAGIAVAPVLSLLVGPAANSLPLLLGVAFLVAPYFILRGRKATRAGRIKRNLLLILSYLAAVKSVAISFTDAMRQVKTNPQMGRMFSLDIEADLYMNLYSAIRVESESIRTYADTIPDDYYRDTIRTMLDVEDNEGFRAVFRMFVQRLHDFSNRYLTMVSSTFENIGSTTISVIMLVQTTLPILMLLTAPESLPIILLLGGSVASLIILSVGNMALPSLPSEYINAKQRYRKAAVVFAVTSAGLTVLESLLAPDLLLYMLVLNIPVAFMTAVWYASLYDLNLNSSLLDKFPDILLMLSTAMARTSYVSEALYELSYTSSIPGTIRAELRRLSRIAKTYHTLEKVPFKGVYWFKYLLFLLNIAQKHGTTPRDLYHAISNFMMEFKKFTTRVKAFSRSMLFMSILALLIVTIEVHIIGQYLEAFSAGGIGAAAKRVGAGDMVPTLSAEKVDDIVRHSYISLLVIAIVNGVAMAKVSGNGTVREGKWVLAMFLIELVLVFLAKTTGFGIHLTEMP